MAVEDIFRPPTPIDAACIAEDVYLAAVLCSLIGEQGEHLAVMQGPRVERDDFPNEVIRKCNSAARLRVSKTFLIGLAPTTVEMMRRQLNGSEIVLTTVSELVENIRPLQRSEVAGELRCHPSTAAYGLIQAKRERKLLVLDDAAPLVNPLPFSRRHVIALDFLDPLTQIIAANFAFSIGADLVLLPQVERRLSDDLYYWISSPDKSHRDRALAEAKVLLAPVLELEDVDFFTFVTTGVPYGYFLANKPTTHLIAQPHLGEQIIANICWSRIEPIASCAVILDAMAPSPSEADVIAEALSDEGMIVYKVAGENANLETTRHFLEVFPYDLFFICSHGGDLSGYRLEVRVRDSLGMDHIVVFEEAVQFSSLRYGDWPPNHVEVNSMIRPLKIDGHPWHAAPASLAQPMGEILKALHGDKRSALAVLTQTPVERVRHSNAIGLNRGALMVNLVQAVGPYVAPVIFNNSCTSFRDASTAFSFAGARAYVGTLVEVEEDDAHQVATRIFSDGDERNFSLPLAVWRAQREAFPDSRENIYLHLGCHFNRLGGPNVVAYAVMQTRLAEARLSLRRSIESATGDTRLKFIAQLDFLNSVD